MLIIPYFVHIQYHIFVIQNFYDSVNRFYKNFSKKLKFLKNRVFAESLLSPCALFWHRIFNKLLIKNNFYFAVNNKELIFLPILHMMKSIYKTERMIQCN